MSTLPTNLLRSKYLYVLALGLVISTALYLYGPTVQIGFLSDDFAWNSIGAISGSTGELVDNLMAPRAQGTVRILSERLFFYLASVVSPHPALLQRAIVLFTMVFVVILLFAECYRNTSSALNSAAATLLWVCSPSTGHAMAWLSSFNQVLCALFSLLVFRWFREGNHTLCVLAFLAGLASHEAFATIALVVMAYALWIHPERIRLASFLLLLAMSFALFWFLLVRKPQSEGYELSVSTKSLELLSAYLQMAIGMRRSLDSSEFGGPVVALVFIIAGTLILYAIWNARTPKLALIFLGWWIVTMTPFLLLSNHPANYYLPFPMIGLSLGVVTCIGTSHGSKAAHLVQGLAVALLFSAAYCGASRVVAIEQWYYDQSTRVERLLAGIRDTASRHPNGLLVVQSIEPVLFMYSLRHIPESTFKGSVLLSASASAQLGNAVPTKLQASDADLVIATSRRPVVAVDVKPDGALDAIRPWQPSTNNRSTSVIIRANSLEHTHRFADGWFPREDGGRWMSRSAFVTLEPFSPTSRTKVTIHGWLPPGILTQGSVMLELILNGEQICKERINSVEVLLSCPLVYQPPTRRSSTLTITTDRDTVVAPDVRRLAFFVDYIKLSDITSFRLKEE